jgi:hypothetical protein
MSDTYFEDARTLFLTDGWRTFQEEIEEAISVLTLEHCDSVEEFWQARGRLSALRQFAGYENGILAAEELEDERDL